PFDATRDGFVLGEGSAAVAPRFRACSNSSSTTAAEPSPITNPSRVASNGRDAVAGSSLRSDSAFMLAKPLMAMGDTVASAPPAIMRSASPYWMVRYASPTACALEAHADTVA